MEERRVGVEELKSRSKDLQASTQADISSAKLFMLRGLGTSFAPSLASSSSLSSAKHPSLGQSSSLALPVGATQPAVELVACRRQLRVENADHGSIRSVREAGSAATIRAVLEGRNELNACCTSLSESTKRLHGLPTGERYYKDRRACQSLPSLRDRASP